MPRISLRATLAPLALLSLSMGAYFLVLGGVVPLRQEASVILTAIAGVTTVGAAIIRAQIPALSAGVATLGFGLGITMSGFVVTIASALTILGGLGFLISTVHLIGKRAHDTTPV